MGTVDQQSAPASKLQFLLKYKPQDSDGTRVSNWYCVYVRSSSCSLQTATIKHVTDKIHTDATQRAWTACSASASASNCWRRMRRMRSARSCSCVAASRMCPARVRSVVHVASTRCSACCCSLAPFRRSNASLSCCCRLSRRSCAAVRVCCAVTREWMLDLRTVTGSCELAAARPLGPPGLARSALSSRSPVPRRAIFQKWV